MSPDVEESAALQSPALSVVIGSLNRCEFLKATIASVRSELAQEEREIIVVDGGSDDGSLDWLVEQKDVMTIIQYNRGSWNGQDLPRRSWGYFMNIAFRASSAPLVCMLSDDCLVVPGAIRNGMEVLASNGKLGAVAFYWRNWPEEDKYSVGYSFGDRMFVNHGIFRAQALRDVDYIDADSYAFYHADGDLGQRMWEAGWECAASPSSFVEHFSHANPRQRAANRLVASQDWSEYESRWKHLGMPKRGWHRISHDDQFETAESEWGPVSRRDRLSLRGRLVFRRLLNASAKRLSRS